MAFTLAANGTHLVTTKSLFVRLTINFSLFAFELPILYLPFVNILKDMGIWSLNRKSDMENYKYDPNAKP